MIDTHCHLNDFEAFPDAQQAVQEALDAGVNLLIVVGIDEEWSDRAVFLAESHPNVFAVVGHHPNSAATFTEKSLHHYEQLWYHPKVLAIGEIGLDFHWNYASLEQQQNALQCQLDLASSLDAPVVFHCREAYPSLLDILEKRPPRPYLFHCFAGDDTDATRAIKLDAYFGVDGPLTYKKADALRAIVNTLPRDRILIETDAPWMSPEPYRGKPNHPAKLPLILTRLADIWECSNEEAEAITGANARAFFRKLPPI